MRCPAAEVTAFVEEHRERRAGNSPLDELPDTGYVLSHALGAPGHHRELAWLAEELWMQVGKART